MREQRDVSVQRTKVCDGPIDAIGNLRGRFAARTTGPNTIAARAQLANVRRAPPYEIAKRQLMLGDLAP